MCGNTVYCTGVHPLCVLLTSPMERGAYMSWWSHVYDDCPIGAFDKGLLLTQDPVVLTSCLDGCGVLVCVYTCTYVRVLVD
jgi:hypothetical protein